ncbi:ABC transporter related [Delftia acidovorans SPH-1]|uniref:ABC transporter related n=1 Tax=Delftia acidovorans (strain DSM 14801 / SPH-1) TaxID=398578 RepID=A9BYA0_DELAS|nr:MULTISPECIES: ATP-binding cassette domain-containing protein [Delftia]MBA4004995.1 ABC transporter [Delftia sp.]ABX34239.1 ABC transporter related [Delftia acidovorans SPH-1]MCP4514873.1 ATP-binding cassette domain-containing protein [Delftia sp.]MCP4529626.1 ATP-binding cassette domain-containing protein [Delftia sp.]OLE07328.1 MAG: ABC transporter [Delftia sp. 13_1_20CM_4_67_18]
MNQDYSLQVAGLGASFGARVILAEVDFALPARGVTVLLGPSGSGKSTLLRTLADLNAANPRFRRWGSTRYAGQPWRSGLQAPRLVQQQARLMMASTFDAIVELARPRLKLVPHELRDWCRAQVQAFGFPELALMFDQPALQLSPVQQRAVAILREALAEPALLMVDEPTAELEGYEAFVLLELLRQVAQRSAVLMSTHHQQHAQAVAQDMLLLAGGRIAEAQSMEAFQRAPLSLAGQQFLRTGSCAVASPDARAEDLEEGVPLPPPLPAAAVAAISEFLSDAVAAEPASEPMPAPALAPEPVPVPASMPAPVSAPTPTPAAAAAARPRAVNPAVLVDWQPLAADPQAVPASRGPNGFAWLVPGRLAGAPQPGVVQSMDFDLKALRGCGVTVLITLTENDLPQEPLQRHGLRNLHLPVRDHESPTVAQIQMLLARMSAMLRAGEVLAVHCLAGLGRTGTVLAAWLVREGLTADEALRRVRLIDAQYVQSQAQEDLLYAYEVALLLKMG